MEEAEALTHTLALLQQWVDAAEAALRTHEAAQLASDAQPRHQPSGGDVLAAQRPAPQPAADQAQPAAEAARPPADAVTAQSADAPAQAQPAQAAPQLAQPADAAGQASGPAAATGAGQGQPADEDDGGIELGTSEALDALLSHDVGPDLDAMEAAMRQAPTQPAAPLSLPAALAGVRGSLSIKTLSQLVKSALSMEVEVGDLQERLLTALKQQRWRIRVEAALKPNSKYTGGTRCLGPTHAAVPRSRRCLLRDCGGNDLTPVLVSLQRTG